MNVTSTLVVVAAAAWLFVAHLGAGQLVAVLRPRAEEFGYCLFRLLGGSHA